jgi:hypothetical protein
MADAENSFDAAVIGTQDATLEIMGRTISYLPLVGGSRSIKAVIDYMPVEALPGIPAANSPKVTITVANDATKGISTAEFDSGGDMVNIPWPHQYSAKQNRRIVQKLMEDAGMVTYEVR